jgi:hypothetical protein
MIEHLTLLLPQQEQFFTFPVGLALGALLGGIFVEYYGHKRKKDENKIKVYSRLKGEKPLVKELFESVASMNITIEHNRAFKIQLKRESPNDPNAIEIIQLIDRYDPTLRIRHDDEVSI